jgi:hypothetical protein
MTLLNHRPSRASLFAPSLPHLPSYPRSCSPTFKSTSRAPLSKRPRRPAFQSTKVPYYSCDGLNSGDKERYSCMDDDGEGEEDEGLMAHSIYSDADYRSSLIASATNNSRKRGLDSDSDNAELDKFGYRVRDRDSSSSESGAGGGISSGGGKRRIIDVVGGTLGGVLRGAWEIVRPIARIPFYGSNSTVCSDPPQDSPPLSPHKQQDTLPPTSAPTTWEKQQGEFWQNHNGIKLNNDRRLRPRASTANLTDYHATMEPVLSARWIMVPTPSPTSSPRFGASTAPTSAHTCSSPSSPSSATRRHQLRSRPIIAAKKKGLRGRPAPLRSPSNPHTPPAYSPFWGMRANSARPGSGHGHSRSRCGGSMGSYAGVRGMGGGGGGIGMEDNDMDDDMKRFNEKLKAMIREGKEALGATVEVVYDDDVDISDGDEMEMEFGLGMGMRY